MNLEFWLGVASAVFAGGAAVMWALVAAQKTPDSIGLTWDMTNFDWLTKPLARQATFNRYGAMCAALAALTQAVALGVHAAS